MRLIVTNKVAIIRKLMELHAPLPLNRRLMNKLPFCASKNCETMMLPLPIPDDQVPPPAFKLLMGGNKKDRRRQIDDGAAVDVCAIVCRSNATVNGCPRLGFEF